jgi:hypothetical protein
MLRIEGAYMEKAVVLSKAIEAFGGHSALARRFNWSLSTVHSWSRRDSLPHWRAMRIAAVAYRQKLDVFADPRKRKRKRNARHKKRAA